MFFRHLTFFPFLLDIVPITVGGKLVVMGSILAGVAIVPSQAAALVEAFLSRQDAKRNRYTVSAEPRAASRDGNKMVLDTSLTCERCGSCLHWENALYCYSCGAEL